MAASRSNTQEKREKTPCLLPDTILDVTCVLNLKNRLLVQIEILTVWKIRILEDMCDPDA